MRLYTLRYVTSYEEPCRALSVSGQGKNMAKIAVVGAGAVGLSTAVCIQNEIPGAQVTVISDLWYQDTTSNVAAGVFRPDHVLAENPADVPKWIECSAKRYWKLYASREAPVAGIFQLAGYIFSNNDPDLPAATQYRDVIPHYRTLSGRELDNFGGPWRYGAHLSTLIIEPRLYLRFLGREFEEQGGTFVNERITSLRDLQGWYDVVVNCSGLGARTLVPDDSLVPVRGQVVRVKAPWLKEFCIGENIAYVYPNSETVVLGGTREAGEWDTTPSKRVTDEIVARCSRLIPALQDAEIVGEWVGLRPWRPTLRLEREVLPLEGDKSLPVVHNYGHAGNGIALSWGCGQATAELVKESLLLQ